jgi:hypothetical protein
MAHFYFDVFIGSTYSHDEVGCEIDNLHAAEIEALRSAGELAQDQLRKLQSPTPEDVRVEVRDEHRQPLLTVTVSIRIERAGLMPTIGP